MQTATAEAIPGDRQKFYDRLTPLLQNYITLPSMRQIAAFAILFFIMLILMALINYVLITLVSMADIGGTDRLLGMLFGVARGVVMVIALLFIIGFTPFTKDPWWHGSPLVQEFVEMAKWGCQFLPPDIQKTSSICSGS